MKNRKKEVLLKKLTNDINSFVSGVDFDTQKCKEYIVSALEYTIETEKLEQFKTICLLVEDAKNIIKKEISDKKEISEIQNNLKSINNTSNYEEENFLNEKQLEEIKLFQKAVSNIKKYKVVLTKYTNMEETLKLKVFLKRQNLEKYQ